PVEGDVWQVRGQVAFDLDVRLPGRRTEEVYHLLNDRNEIGRLDLQILDPGEAQEIVRDFDQTLAFALEALGTLQGAAFAQRLRFLEVFRQELEIQAERAEVVLDFVDEAACQLGQFGIAVAR